jgi:hypothetical protein
MFKTINIQIGRLATYELVIMTLNSGVMALENGTASTFLHPLTKADVLDALQQQPYSHYEIHRLIGGGFFRQNQIQS